MRLKELAQNFHHYLEEVKSKTPLHPDLRWYPWPTLAAFDHLDEMVGGDVRALRRMIGPSRALDVGCGDGDTVFFLESLGAAVDAVDHAPTNYNALYGVAALKEALGSPVRVEAVDIDTRPQFPEEYYGLTVMLGVLYHLKNPYLVLEELARRSNYIFLSTRIAQLGPDRKTAYNGFPVAYLVDEDELNADPTNFWIFTDQCLKRIVKRAGWDIVHYVVKGAAKSDPVSPDGDARAYLVAKSRVRRRDVLYQRLDGLGELQNDAWRWTARTFSFSYDIEDPLEDAVLRLRFHIHPASFAPGAPVTLRGRVHGKELPPIAFAAAGPQEYTVKLGAMEPARVRVEFEVDRVIGPTADDDRELGVQVMFEHAPIQIT